MPVYVRNLMFPLVNGFIMLLQRNRNSGESNFEYSILLFNGGKEVRHDNLARWIVNLPEATLWILILTHIETLYNWITKAREITCLKPNPKTKGLGHWGGTSFLSQTVTGWTVSIYVSHGKPALFGSNLIEVIRLLSVGVAKVWEVSNRPHSASDLKKHMQFHFLCCYIFLIHCGSIFKPQCLSRKIDR